MEYSVISVTDGNNVVRAEHITNIEDARKTWHHWCELLINDNTFEKGMVKLLDENLDTVDGKIEYIEHEPVVELIPEPESTEEES